MMKASDIMTKDVATISSSATVAEAIKLMQEGNWRSLIVDRENEQDAYGIVTDTDIQFKVTATGNDPQQIQVREIMTKPCIVVNPDLSVENVLRLFLNNRILRAPVIQKELLGIISISDILVKSPISEQLQATFPDTKLQKLIQNARSAYQQGGIHSDAHPQAWDVFEENLSALSQQHAETILHTALKNYFEEFEQLQDSKILDNLCSG
ncbi:MAG: CBS domain-containing protein [Leptolyngbyaceae cyanobacterium RM1_406_9]|nr:CBS domain-containing protein [Leptolyngbyaceae cyanobacterium RM1_406_9]